MRITLKGPHIAVQVQGSIDPHLKNNPPFHQFAVPLVMQASQKRRMCLDLNLPVHPSIRLLGNKYMEYGTSMMTCSNIPFTLIELSLIAIWGFPICSLSISVVKHLKSTHLTTLYVSTR